MARFTRTEVATKMYATGLVPVFYNAKVEVAKEVMKSCYIGGVRCFEFTNRGELAHEVFTELIKFARRELPELALGIGSVIDGPTAALYLQIGADFVVSPILNPEMAKICNRRKVLWAPGCGSLSEISQAEELGAEVVKIFPGKSVGGPEFIKAVKGPCPWTSIMPTGGVSPTKENIGEWISAGAHCLGMGSKLIEKAILEEENYIALEEKVTEIISTIQSFRNI